MKKVIIAHRGNIVGKQPESENRPDYLLEAAERFDVEVDVWVHNHNKILLGHDIGEHEVPLDFLRNPKFWCHAKNVEALAFMLANGIGRCFYHDRDDATVTSNGFIWTYPGKVLTSISIAVLPEWGNDDVSKAYGVCTDYCLRYDGAATSLVTPYARQRNDQETRT